MAETASTIRSNPFTRILKVLKLEKQEITSIYFYAILSGLVQLSLPLGIQSIISFVLGGSISTSLIVLIVLVVLGVLFNGFISVQQMQLIEKVQQQLFVRYSFEYAHKIPRLDLKSVDKYYLPELIRFLFKRVFRNYYSRSPRQPFKLYSGWCCFLFIILFSSSSVLSLFPWWA